MFNPQEGGSHLKPGALTSPGLFLDRHDLQDLVFQRRTQEEVNDLRLLQKRQATRFTKSTLWSNFKVTMIVNILFCQLYLDGQRIQVDLLQGLDLHVLHQTAEFGHRHPL